MGFWRLTMMQIAARTSLGAEVQRIIDAHLACWLRSADFAGAATHLANLNAAGPATRERDHLRHILRGGSDTLRHPRVAALVRDGAERVRVVPDAAMRHVAALPALGMPCLCRAGEDCLLQLPAFFLPDPDETEAGLIRVAQATWKRWAEQHAAWTGHDHPARVALKALADRAAGAGDA